MQYRGKQHDRRMSPHEKGRGWAFFALFVLVFPPLMGFIQRSFDGVLPVAEANVIYYLLSATLVFLVFWNYLKNGFFLLLDRLPENLFALITGLGGGLIFQLFFHALPYPVENPNLLSYPEQFALSPQATLVILTALMPVVEEVLFRGLLFGSVRPYSKGLAWTLSVVTYCLYCVWQFVFAFGGADPRYLLLGLQYLPMAVALTWCYDRGGSIWSAAALHGLINAYTLFTVL